MEDFKTIAVFTYASEYTVLQHLLQQANIRFVFTNETMLGVLPFHSNAIGGIRLQVHKNDVEEARQIMDNLHNASPLKIV